MEWLGQGPVGKPLDSFASGCDSQFRFKAADALSRFEQVLTGREGCIHSSPTPEAVHVYHESELTFSSKNSIITTFLGL